MEENKSCPTFHYCSKCDLCKAERFHPVKPRWYVKCIPWVIGVFVVIFAIASLIVAGLVVAIEKKIINLEEIYGEGGESTGHPGIIIRSTTAVAEFSNTPGTSFGGAEYESLGQTTYGQSEETYESSESGSNSTSEKTTKGWFTSEATYKSIESSPDSTSEETTKGWFTSEETDEPSESSSDSTSEKTTKGRFTSEETDKPSESSSESTSENTTKGWFTSEETNETSESSSDSTLEKTTKVPEKLTHPTCVKSKLNATDAIATISPESGLMLEEMFSKKDEEEILRRSKNSKGHCGGEYLIGHRVNLARAWTSLEKNVVLAGYTESSMWSPTTKDRSNSFRCAGLSKEHNYKIINLPCSYPTNTGICYICETNNNCPVDVKPPCYKTYPDFVYGAKMGSIQCGLNLIGGRLAIPRNETVWTKIKERHRLDDQSGRCKVAYLNLFYEPFYKPFREKGSSYKLSIVDYTEGKMSDHCVTTRGSDFFVLTSCEKPHCYCVANITKNNNLKYKMDESTEPLTGPAIEDYETDEYTKPSNRSITELASLPTIKGLKLYTTPMDKSSAEKYCRESGNALLLLYRKEEINTVRIEHGKLGFSQHCAGKFLTGYSLVMKRLIRSNSKSAIPKDVAKAISSSVVENVRYSHECSALSKRRGNKIIHYPCDFRYNPQICFICETHHNCSNKKGAPCYRTYFEPINGQLMAQDRCFHLSPRGRLAEPFDKNSWETLTKIYQADNPSGRCKFALTGLWFKLGYDYQSSRNAYLIKPIDLREGTLDKNCVIITLNAYIYEFKAVSCNQKHCLAIFDNSGNRALSANISDARWTTIPTTDAFPSQSD